jgi:3-oxoacyl-[acyl-carrier protein] reductase
LEFRDKVALVTGSSSGIGRGLVLALAERGCSVVINYVSSEDQAKSTFEEVDRMGGKALLCQADVSREADCQGLVNQALEHWGRLDFLINNAGTTVFSPLEEVTEADWDRIFGVNVKGAFFMARAAIGALRASGGSIVNISSIASLNGVGSSIPYSASKAALNNLTQSLAQELAPEIRVNGVAPGFVDTPWAQRQFGERLNSVRKFIRSRTALDRVNRVEDVVQVVLSVLTGMNQVTGQTIVVDGGYQR